MDSNEIVPNYPPSEQLIPIHSQGWASTIPGFNFNLGNMQESPLNLMTHLLTQDSSVIENHLVDNIHSMISNLCVFRHQNISNILNRSLTNDTQLKRDNTKSINMKKDKFRLNVEHLKQYLRNHKKKIPDTRKKIIQESLVLKKKIKKPFVECTICTEQFENSSDDIYKMPCCKQDIHCKCLDEWIKYKMSCPFCTLSLKKYQA